MVNTTTNKQPNAAESHRYDKNEVKTAARGRWGELLNLFASIPADYLDGRHHGCPICRQGTDRFRALDDFAETGAVYCNKCHDTENGDGFAAIMKATGKPFPEVLADVGEYLGVQPRPSKNGDARRNGQNGSKPKKNHRDPLAEVNWFDEQVAKACSPFLDRWCKKKPPVTRRAVEAFGGRLCRWPKTNGYLCIGFTGRDLDGTPKAVLLYRVDGQLFPATKNLSERKTHLVAGSAESWLFSGDQFPAAASVFHKCEGLPDSMTLASAGLPDGHVAMTNACGAKSHRKLDYSWAKDKGIVIAADADRPGMEGGKLHAARAHQAGAAWVKLITPPGYEITDDGGRDFRDWFAEGHTMDEYLALAEAAPAVTAEEAKDWAATRKSDKKNDGAITNAIEIDTGEDTITEALPMAEVVSRILKATGDWPRRVDTALFTDDGEVAWLSRPASLFGWLSRHHGVIEWHRTRGCVSKEEVFAELQRTARPHQAIEQFPHEPPVPGHYYACDPPEPGDGKRLAELLGFFCPESDIDRQLIQAAFATPLWGGPAGARPAILITAQKGRGRGKSKLAQYLAYLWGGHIDVSPNEDMAAIKTRLLTAEALPLRVAILDNVKTTRFSWGELEAIITSPVISGRRLYVGNGSRPNFLTWLITVNGASLSTDMAQRVVEIKLADPDYDGTWEERLRAFIDEHRQAIIADLVAFLRSPPKTLRRSTRWASWERGVLACVENPDACLDAILARREQMDVEQEEGEIIEDYFAGRLRGLGYDPDRDDVFLPNEIAARWFNAATNDNRKVSGVTRSLKQFRDEGRITRIVQYRDGSTGERGFRFVGDHADAGAATKYDIRRRIAEKQQNTQDRQDRDF